MNSFKDREILDDGTVICKLSTALELLYRDNELTEVFVNDKEECDQFKVANYICDSTFPEPTYADTEKYSNIDWNNYWLTPEPYSNIDLKEYCYERCKTQEEFDRVDYELTELEKRNMFHVIRHLIYCINIWRQNKVLWGVGRGSSVSSFVLYLIGINRINPLKYNLEVTEWLK